MAAIVIGTQPSNATINKYATATFTSVLSGSIEDEVSYLTSSQQWFVSSSHAAIVGGTSLTLTQSNVPYSDNGKKFYMTFHSASTPGTMGTSSAVSMSVLDIPRIVIGTQPSSTTVKEFATATFTAVLSGSYDDTVSYLTASMQWRVSGSWAAVAGATGATLTLTNVQETDTGNKYYFTAHSASAVDTIVTSSVVMLTVQDIQTAYNGIDQAPTTNTNYSHLGVGEGYKWYIPLLISGSEVNEKYCPHFISKHDMREYINKEVEAGGFTLLPVVVATPGPTGSDYRGFVKATAKNQSFRKLGYKDGYKIYLPLMISGSYVGEKYCPHFASEEDFFSFIDRESASLDTSLGE